jgi:hypothetical protein
MPNNLIESFLVNCKRWNLSGNTNTWAPMSWDVCCYPVWFLVNIGAQASYNIPEPKETRKQQPSAFFDEAVIDADGTPQAAGD